MAIDGQLQPRYMNMRAAVLVANAQGDNSQETAEVLEHLAKKLTVVPYFYNPGTGMLEIGRQPSTGGSGAGSTVVDANLTSAGSTKVAGYFSLQPTTPGSSNDYLWVRTVTAGAGSTAVDATLTSDGSTREVGTVRQGAGSTSVAPWYVISSGGGAGSTTVDANLTSAGSTKEVGIVALATSTGIKGAVSLATAGTTATLGQVAISNPTTAVSLSTAPGITSGSSEVALTSVGSTRLVGRVDVNNTVSVTGTTSVTVSSGVVLGAGSSANILGSVVLNSGTTDVTLGGVVIEPGSSANMVGQVVLGAGTSANLVGGVVINSGTTAITVGSVALLAGGSTIGSIQQGAGSSANFWSVDGLAFTSANTSRTTVNTTVDASVVATNANRRGLVIQNLTTVDLALGFSTGAVTTGLANTSYILGSREKLTFGGPGGIPLFVGPIRGLIVGSTVITGGVAVTQFINT